MRVVWFSRKNRQTPTSPAARRSSQRTCPSRSSSASARRRAAVVNSSPPSASSVTSAFDRPVATRVDDHRRHDLGRRLVTVPVEPLDPPLELGDRQILGVVEQLPLLGGAGALGAGQRVGLGLRDLTVGQRPGDLGQAGQPARPARHRPGPGPASPRSPRPSSRPSRPSPMRRRRWPGRPPAPPTAARLRSGRSPWPPRAP